MLLLDPRRIRGECLHRCEQAGFHSTAPSTLAGIVVAMRFAEVKEEPATRAGDTQQNAWPPLSSPPHHAEKLLSFSLQSRIQARKHATRIPLINLKPVDRKS